MLGNVDVIRKFWKNTMIVFTSDNGGALHYGASNKPFSGGNLFRVS